MASTIVLTSVLLPLILLFLQGSYAADDVEARRDTLACNRLTQTCSYPESCQCDWQSGPGEVVQDLVHYNPSTNQCVQGGKVANCNGFTRMNQCEASCVNNVRGR
ncbi:R.appendiculatus Kunitz/BPTI-like protein [Dermacentor silvarum]|uniref:R.appendiculatus Kunitz/BPTI-like protein n=1 Tax=Dermacentor silvarum TaxID=543639 RepID=UPI00210092C5|nr:R.appendiculatus Kunitz/BPTI-like protein [Dermacentor silvarum]